MFCGSLTLSQIELNFLVSDAPLFLLISIYWKSPFLSFPAPKCFIFLWIHRAFFALHGTYFCFGFGVLFHLLFKTGENGHHTFSSYHFLWNFLRVWFLSTLEKCVECLNVKDLGRACFLFEISNTDYSMSTICISNSMSSVIYRRNKGSHSLESESSQSTLRSQE